MEKHRNIEMIYGDSLKRTIGTESRIRIECLFKAQQKNYYIYIFFLLFYYF